VIAGQIAAVDGQGAVQRVSEFQIVAAGRSVEGEVAAVDDKIRARRIDVIADAMKIISQRRETAGEVGIGNLGESKFGHARFLPAAIIYFDGSRNDDKFPESHTQTIAVIASESGRSSIPEQL
jgi:hypothetical protein